MCVPVGVLGRHGGSTALAVLGERKRRKKSTPNSEHVDYVDIYNIYRNAC